MLHEQFVAKWERTRRKGRQHFVWVRGVLGMGVSWGVLFSLAMFLVLSAEKHPDPWVVFPLTAIVSPLFGYISGAVIWSWGEWKYEETVLLLEASGRRVPRTAPEVNPVSEATQRLDDFRPW
jgi:hypothetical protein